MNLANLKKHERLITSRLHLDNAKLNEEMDTLKPTEKVMLIEKKFREIMLILGMDLSDDSLKETPLRVAKMYVNELFGGLLPENEPAITLFDNKYQYSEMLIEKNIPVYSCCEHHFVPITGKAHIGYISSGKIIGLSKLNRVVNYFSRRPQVQERLTVQVADYLKNALGTENVAVVINAEHMCIAARGIKDAGCTTYTGSYNGVFLDTERRNQFDLQIKS